MVLELRDKLPQGAAKVGAVVAGHAAASSTTADLLAGALTRMGYRPAETERAIAALGDRLTSAPLPELVRDALALLSK
jgi:Holliday junction DNA helicase RuvA